ncbi:MAG: redoxin domain-containing protein, partial [Acidobacteriota bacterium]
IPLLGQALPTFEGKLDPKLVVDTFHMYQRVWSAAADTSKFRFKPAPEKNAVISVGELIDTRNDSGKSTVLLVEPSGGNPYIWFDSNADGIYDASEKVVMDAPPDKPDIVTVTLRLPIKNAFYPTFPIFIHYLRGFKHPRLADTDRLITQSAYANAWGHVNIAGKSVLFQYPFDARSPAISTTEGVFGVDTDGDGRIRDEQFSRESSYAAKVEVVLPLGDIFVSTTSIDMATGRIVVRQRDKKDYQRIDLEVGKEMPDFVFSDLDGKQRHLSDFRGKYVMIDFWGVWCGDCTRETPFQLAAYERFRKQNFEILGLDSDEKIETLRTYLKKNKITWTQATNESIKDLANISYRIQEYPSTILLGPEGKVLVLNQRQLQGEALLITLENILPKP